MSEFSVTPEGGESSSPSPQIDRVKYEQRMAELRSEQSVALAIVAGVLASILGAVLWAVITYLTSRQFGLVAIGIGVLVGFAVKYFGNGLDMKFGLIGAFFAFVGCVLGKILTTVVFASFTDGMPLLMVVSTFITSPSIVIEILRADFSFIDLLFYGLAIYEGYRFSIREIGPEDMTGVYSTPPPPPPPVSPEP